MSVVSGKKIIFCEGKQAGLDSSLLNRVVENLPGDKPTIVPAGSKFTFSIFAQGYFFPDKAGDQRYIVFRDRDFDTYPTDNIQLLEMTNARGKVFTLLTHRACVENYLLDASLIHQYWMMKYEEKQNNPSSKWGHGTSPGIEILTDWIESSARHLQEYQSVRWALADLLQMSQARTQLKTTWTGGSGILPLSLTLNDCKTEARNLVNQFIQAVTTITQEAFEANLVKYRSQFCEAEFWNRQDYLVWFHGKDLQKIMQKQEPTYISLTAFFNWAVTQLDITVYPDLIDLRTRIEQL